MSSKRRKKRVAVHEIVSFRKCPAQYADKKFGGRRTSTGSAMGQAVHDIAAGANEEAAIATAIATLNNLEEDGKQVSRALASIKKMAAQAKAATAVGADLERQLIFVDEETGYHVFARPDELNWFRRNRAEIMEIVDIKLGSRLREEYWLDLYEFGLIASLVYDYRGPIRLVVRLVGENRKPIEEERWFSPRLLDSQLDRLRNTIRQIEAAHDSGDFPHNPGFHCRRCPLAASCKENQRDYDWRRAEAATRAAAA